MSHSKFRPQFLGTFTLIMCFLLGSIGLFAQTPNAPTSLSIAPINGGAFISFTAPTVVGSGITNYEYSSDDGASWTACSPAVTVSPVIIKSGLQNCSTYQMRIRAVNDSGAGTASSALSVTPTASAEASVLWTDGASAADNNWTSVAYGNGLFVAVGSTGTNNRVMTSPDGINWTIRTSAANNAWQSVVFGNGLFVAVANSGATGRVMTSPDGITWTQRSPAVVNTWAEVTYGNGLFVAVAPGSASNQVLTSPDGINWTGRTAANTNQWQSVGYGNGLFVAVASSGTGNRVMTSSDAVTWTERTSAQDNSWISVTYGNGLFVAVSTSGTNRIMTSPDGITWTSQVAASNITLSNVTYGNGLFVAVGSSAASRVMSSTDGVVWNSRGPSTQNTWNSVAYGNGRFVAVASTGTGNRAMSSGYQITANAPTITGITPVSTTASVSYTTSLPSSLPSMVTAPAVSSLEYSIDNGSTWVRPSTAITSSPFTISGLVGTNQIKVRAVNAAGLSCPSAASSAIITTSYDLPNAPTNLNAAGVNNGAYITFDAPSNTGNVNAAAGLVSNYEYSVDSGNTWTACSPVVRESPLFIETGLTNCTSYSLQIRAVNSTGSGTASSYVLVQPKTSTDPETTWITRSSAADNAWAAITYGNGLFVTVATSGTGDRIMTSPDGVNWTIRTSPADNSWRSVTYGNGLFVAVSGVGTNKVMTSPDGINWTARLSAVEGNQWNSVIYANGQFVCVGQIGIGNRVMTSQDGITWTTRAAANDNAWRAVAFGNGRYVAVSNNGVGNRIMTSEDGFNWTLVNSPADNSWEGICYGNGLFVAVASSGTGNRVMTSPDGLTWTLRNSASDNNWVNVTYGNGLFVAVASTGTGDRVMTSTDGITWTSGASAADNAWNFVAYGNGKFVAVSGSGTGNRVMTNSHQVVRNTPVIDSITVVSAVVSIHFNGNYTSALPAGVDTSAISNIEYSLDNGATWSTPSPEVTTSPFTLTNLPSGEYQVKIRSLNSTGTSCGSTDSFKISVGIPTATLSAPSGTSTCLGGGIPLKVSASGDLATAPYTIWLKDNTGDQQVYTQAHVDSVFMIYPQSDRTYSIDSMKDASNYKATDNVGAIAVTVTASPVIASSGTIISKTLNHLDGYTLTYASGDSCKSWVRISDSVGGTNPGSTTCLAELITGNLFNSTARFYVKRRVNIAPTTNGVARVTLLFSQTDFDNFNSLVTYQEKLPINSTDTVGVKSKIRIRRTTSSIETNNTTEFSPDTVIWNASNSSWEVNFRVDDGVLAGNYYLSPKFTSTKMVTGLTHIATTPVPGNTLAIVKVDWDSLPGVAQYRMRFRPQGSTDWNVSTITGAERTLTTLAFNTTYEVQIRAYESQQVQGEYTSTYTFTTPEQPAALPSCAAPTSIVATVNSSTSATLSWSSGLYVAQFNVQMRVKNSSTWGGTSTSSNSITFNSLSPNTTYEFRIRKVCEVGLTNNGISEFSVVDTFRTSAPSLLPCATVDGLGTVSQTTNGAVLKWNKVNFATSYFVQVRLKNAATWGGLSTNDTSISLNSLSPSSVYEYRIRANCNNSPALTTTNTGLFSAIAEFNTLSAPALGTCLPPSNIQATPITNSVNLTWSAASNGASYFLNIKPTASSNNWGGLTVSALNSTLTSLSPNTSYTVRIRTNCTPGSTTNARSSFSDTLVFVTNALANKFELGAVSQSAVRLYPNPTRNWVHIDYTSETDEPIYIHVRDITGRLLKTVHSVVMVGDNPIDIDMFNFSAGMYMIQISQHRAVQFTHRIQKVD